VFEELARNSVWVDAQSMGSIFLSMSRQTENDKLYCSCTRPPVLLVVVILLPYEYTANMRVATDLDSIDLIIPRRGRPTPPALYDLNCLTIVPKRHTLTSTKKRNITSHASYDICYLIMFCVVIPL